MKLLITGTPGSGKTFLVQYAHEHAGRNYFDTDAVKGLCEWRDYKTGDVVGAIEDIEPTGGELWYKTNGWYWKKSRMDELAASVSNPVICGSADNVMDFYGYFDKIALLYKSREDIVSNLTQPGREQPNGKDPAHHDRILKWQDRLLETLKPHAPIIITDNDIRIVFHKVSSLMVSM